MGTRLRFRLPELSTLVFLALILTPNPVTAAGPFDRGAMRVNLILSRATALGDDYAVYGVGFGYFVMNGLELGISYETWQGGPLDIDQLTPELRYVFRNQTALQPYVGTFFRRTFISQLEDLDAYGFRLGVFFKTGRRIFFGVGGVYTKYKDCNPDLVVSCDNSYPEFLLAFGF